MFELTIEGQPILLGGDIITQVNGKVLGDPTALATLLSGLEVGSKLKLTVVRNGKPNAVELTPRRATRPAVGPPGPSKRRRPLPAAARRRRAGRAPPARRSPSEPGRRLRSQLDRATGPREWPLEHRDSVRRPPRRRYNGGTASNPRASPVRALAVRPSRRFLKGNSLAGAPRSKDPTPCHIRKASAHESSSRRSSARSPRTTNSAAATINPMELYQNQVTRAQGPFSLRMFHRSWGIMLIQHNIPAPSTVLDFPTREAFVRELQEGRYDIVGLSGIIVNVGKIREMCRLVREHSPESTIVVGGHVAAIPGLGPHDRRRRDREGRGRPVVPRVPRRGSRGAHRAPDAAVVVRHAGDGDAQRRRRGQSCRDDHPFRGLPDRLQLLHDLVVLRREGQERHVPRARGGCLPRDVRGRGGAGCAVLLRDGRELPARPAAGDRTARMHEARAARRGRCTCSRRPMRSRSTRSAS